MRRRGQNETEMMPMWPQTDFRNDPQKMATKWHCKPPNRVKNCPKQSKSQKQQKLTQN